MKVRRHLCGLALAAPWAGATGCSPVAGAGPAELATPVELSALLALGATATADAPGLALALELVDEHGRPVPHGLLQFDWQDGGRTAFQTDARGQFWIRFPEPAELSPALLSLRTVAPGTPFVVEDYEQFSAPLVGGSLRVTASAYAPQ
jgi:hypothetical protein